MRNCFLKDEQRKWFPEIESNPGEDSVKMIEMTIEDLEYYINLVDKTAAVFDSSSRIDSNFEKKFCCG